MLFRPFILYYIILHCIALHCIALHCFVILVCIILFHIVFLTQSLRGCPRSDTSFCVLANYKDVSNRELILTTMPTPAASRAAALNYSTGKQEMPPPLSAVNLPSSALTNDMRGIRRHLLELQQSQRLRGKAVQALKLGQTAIAADALFENDDDSSEKRSRDFDVIFYSVIGGNGNCNSNSNSSSSRPADDQSDVLSLLQVFPAHSFLVDCRCPRLGQLMSHSPATSTSASASTLVRLVDLASLLPAASRTTASMRFLLDYLYSGHSALTARAFKEYLLRGADDHDADAADHRREFRSSILQQLDRAVRQCRKRSSRFNRCCKTCRAGSAGLALADPENDLADDFAAVALVFEHYHDGNSNSSINSKDVSSSVIEEIESFLESSDCNDLWYRNGVVEPVVALAMQVPYSRPLPSPT